MDDDLGPAASAPPSRPNDDAEGGDDSGDEDLVDWTKLPGAHPSAKPVIPKRGDKDFEPAAGGSSLQAYSLERSRQAMTDALRGTRNISSKSVSYGVWISRLARVQVFQARGVLFSSIGHAMRRPMQYAPGEKPRTITTLELIPEEALYLVERGSMLCFKSGLRMTPELAQQLDPDSASFAEEPMTVQQAFSEMIGKENLTLARYQCYAYLKRLGFIVTRATAPSSTPSYPVPPPYELLSRPNQLSPLGRIASWFTWLLPNWLFRIRKPALHTPLWAHSWGLRSSCDYPSIFGSLRVIPSGHGHQVPSSSSKSDGAKPTSDESPYKVFYHIWKPNTPWKKTAPPLPDFELVVVDGRTTPMPSIEELNSMFATLPYIPPPLPRRRTPLKDSAPSSPPANKPSFRSILSLSWLHPLSSAPKKAPSKPHPFAAIRAGNKNVIIGVVDAGNVTFFRFGEGCFDEWPMV